MLTRGVSYTRDYGRDSLVPLSCLKTNISLYSFHLSLRLCLTKTLFFSQPSQMQKKRKFSRQKLEIKFVHIKNLEHEKRRIRTRYVCLLNPIWPICMSITLFCHHYDLKDVLSSLKICIAESDALPSSITGIFNLILIYSIQVL